MRKLLLDYKEKGDQILYLPEFMVNIVKNADDITLDLGDDGCSESCRMDKIQTCQGSTHSRERHEEDIQAGGS